MKACRREPAPRTPIWLMRQAGRYMKEYRDVRARYDFIDLCKDSDLAAEVTVTAARHLGVDAAIIFSDILLILEPLGVQLEYTRREGPVIQNPVRSWDDFKKFRTTVVPLDELSFVFDAVRKARRALPPDLPLIGFSGAPFTLASYLIEGGASRDFVQTKVLMHREPDTWHGVMATISGALIGYLNGQIEAGAQAVQIFDSWAGCLSPEEYKKFVLPHTKWIIKHLQKGVPVIHFGTQTAPFLELMKEAGGDVIGIDWRIGLDVAWDRLGDDVGIMGNLDPAALLEDIPKIRERVRKILDQAAGRPGHIFNLGHGVLPETPVDHVKALVEMVKELSFRSVKEAARAHPVRETD
jgi:uroporphyrinogen decarboxylase